MRLNTLYATAATLALMVTPSLAETTTQIGNTEVTVGDTGAPGADGETVTVTNPSLPDGTVENLVVMGGQAGYAPTPDVLAGKSGDVVVEGILTMEGNAPTDSLSATFEGGSAAFMHPDSELKGPAAGNVSDVTAELKGEIGVAKIQLVGGVGATGQTSDGGGTGLLTVTAKQDAIIHELGLLNIGGPSDFGNGGKTSGIHFIAEEGSVTGVLTLDATDGTTRTLHEALDIPQNANIVTMHEGSQINQINALQPVTVELMQQLESKSVYDQTVADLAVAHGFVVIDGVPLSWTGEVAFRNLMTYAESKPDVPVDVIVVNPGPGRDGESTSSNSTYDPGNGNGNAGPSNPPVKALPYCNTPNLAVTQLGDGFQINVKADNVMVEFGMVTGTTFVSYGNPKTEGLKTKIGESSNGNVAIAVIPGGSCELRPRFN